MHKFDWEFDFASSLPYDAINIPCLYFMLENKGASMALRKMNADEFARRLQDDSELP